MTTRALFLFFIYTISIVSNGVSETIPDDKLLRILITPNRFQTKLNQTTLTRSVSAPKWDQQGDLHKILDR